MDELLLDDRTPRAFRAKFPEEVLQESLAGQLWFGAECLAAGSSIMNREEESAAMRPLAKAVTKSLDIVRNLLREQCLRNNIPNSLTLSLDVNDAATETLYESLKIFDRLFAEFELSYVSAMVQVKTKQEHEMQELICVLFSETLQRALKFDILEQEQVDSFDPSLMFSIPRLSIITGLVIYNKGPLNMDLPAEYLSEMFRPFKTLLIKIKDLLRTLNKNELNQLEKLLCTNEDIHLKNNINNTNCDSGDEKIQSDDELVSGIISSGDCRPNKDIIPSFYSVQETIPNEWEDDKDKDDSNLDISADCPSGFLITNTNFGNLLQTNEAPLTDSFISTTTTSDDEYQNSTNDENRCQLTVTDQVVLHKEPIIVGIDSGISTENTSLDRTPETDSDKPIAEEQNEFLTGRYSSNWENLNKIQAHCSSSKINSDTSDDSEDSTTIEIKSIRRTGSTSMTSTSKRRSSMKKSRDSSSGETSSCQSDGDPKEVALALRAAGRMKFK